MKRISHNSFGKYREIIFLILYRIFLDLLYKYCLSVKYSYYGFFCDVTIFNYCISWMVLLLQIIFFEKVIRDKRSIAYMLLELLILISFVPFTSLFGMGLLNNSFFIANTIYWVLLIFFSWEIGRIKKRRINNHNRKRALSSIQVKIITIISCIIVMFVSWKYAGFRLNFNFSEIYELRAEAELDKMNVVIKYLFCWTRIINPILILYHFKNKDYVFVGICIFCQLLSFGYNGMKAPLLMSILAIVVGAISIKRSISYREALYHGFTFLTGVSLLEGLLTKTWYVAGVLVRRISFLPVFISSCYYDYFCDNPPDYFKNSFLRHFGFETEYSDIRYTISEMYFGWRQNYNCGLISDAIMNLGIVGVVLMPFAIAVVIRILNRCSENVDRDICIIVAVSTAINLTNSFLFTVMLTHGLVIVALLLCLIKQPGRINLGNK